MTTETIDSGVADVLEVIATQLGIAADHVFGVFVGAQPMIGVLNIVLLVVAFGIAYIVGKWVYKTMLPSFKDSDGDWDNDESHVFLALVSVLAGVVALVIVDTSLSGISPSIMQIMYPEYTAVKEIIELVSP